MERQQTATKAHFAAGGAGIGWAVAEMLSYVIWGDAPPPRPELGVALEIIVTAGVAWLATYIAPANKPT